MSYDHLAYEGIGTHSCTKNTHLFSVHSGQLCGIIRREQAHKNQNTADFLKNQRCCVARDKGFEPLRSSLLRSLLRNLIRFAQKTLCVLRSGVRTFFGRKNNKNPAALVEQRDLWHAIRDSNP